MSYTLAQELDFVQTAIRNVESGVQSVTDNDGNTIVYPSLDALYKREQWLRAQVDAASPSSKPMEQRVAEFERQ